MISKDQVIDIARLARLELTEKEIEKMQKDLSSILNYFNLLKKAPKPEKEEPAFAPLSGATAGNARKDQAKAANQSLAKKIIKSFPDEKDDYIKVRTVL